MSYVVIALIFVLIGMACFLEVKNIEIERLSSIILKLEDKIKELENKLKT